MSYKIANIKWLRDQGWNISSSYASDLCPTYNEIVNEIPKGSITVDVSGTYSNNQLVCEKDINIITEKFITLTLNNGSVVDIQGSGELTESIMSSYKGSVVNAVVGTLCTSISKTAFRECPNLESVSISKTVTSVGNGAFAYCNKLTTITVDSGNSIYDSRNNCNGIVKKSSNTLIAGCKATIIPNTVTTVGNSAFWEIESLTSINIPNSVTVLEDDAFSRCYALTSVTLSSNLTTIGRSCFRYCPFTSITIPNSVTTIEQQAFQGGGLVDIVVPDNVTTINVAVYEECTNATAATIHSNVDNIYIRAFSGCSDLTKITVEATNPPTLLTHSEYPSDGINTVFGNTNNCPIYVPCESVNAYKTAWLPYESRITCDSADCSVYNFTTSTSIIDPMSGNIPIAHSSHLNNLEQLSYTIKDGGGFLTGITAYTIYEDEREWEYRGYFNTTTSSSDRTATIEYKNGDGTCVFTQELVMKGNNCDKYGWNGYTLHQGAEDNVGGAVGISSSSAGTLVLYDKPSWVTYLTANTSDNVIAYICKAEDNNSSEERSGDVIFRSPDGSCEFSSTVIQEGYVPVSEVQIRFGGLPSNLTSGGLDVIGSTYTATFILAGPNEGKGTLNGILSPSDSREAMTFSGVFTASSVGGGNIYDECPGYQGNIYTVSTASWNAVTKTLNVNFVKCS